MKKISIPAISALALLCVAAAPAAHANVSAEPYNPVEALRGARTNADARDDSGVPGVPKKERSGGITFSLAPEYFFDFGSDLHDADGWGGSLTAGIHFKTDTPKWDFLAELEFLAFSAESGDFNADNHTVTETVHSANLLINAGLARTFSEKFSLEALVGFGIGATYGEIKGDGFKTSNNGNFTTTLSAKLRGEYRFSENWSAFAGFRAAYIMPSIASKLADWHHVDLFSKSVELGIRLRF